MMRSLATAFATFLIGCGGDGGAADELPPSAVEPAQVAGTWRSWEYEDPLAAVLEQDGATVTGSVCIGCPDGSGVFGCGEIVSGSVEGERVAIHFVAPWHAHPYALELTAGSGSLVGSLSAPQLCSDCGIRFTRFDDEDWALYCPE